MALKKNTRTRPIPVETYGVLIDVNAAGDPVEADSTIQGADIAVLELAERVKRAVSDLRDTGHWAERGPGSIAADVQLTPGTPGVILGEDSILKLVEISTNAEGSAVQEFEGGQMMVSWRPLRRSSAPPGESGNLTQKSKSGNSGTSSNSKKAEPVPDDANASEPAPSPLERDFAKASLGELLDVLVPAVPIGARARLEGVIREAQHSPPSDKASFVHDVNRILDAHNLRLRIEGEEHLARLSVKNGAIALSVAGGVGTRGFKQPRISIEQVAEDYARKRQKPRPPGSDRNQPKPLT